MYQLPEIKPRKKPRPAHRKSDAVKMLEAMAFADAQRKHPNVETKYLSPRTYSDRGANGLTRCVIDFLNLSGHLAERINSTGRYQDNTQTFEDVMGKVRTIGSGRWLPTSGIRGTADISATIAGKSVKIEIKQSDRQSEYQKEYQRRIEAAGGTYVIVRSLAEFMEFYNAFIK